MACCGQKREAVNAETRFARMKPVGNARIQPTSPPISSASSGENTITLRYRPRSAVAVMGPATKTRYQFQGGGSLQAVDRRDAGALVASGMFERVWG